MSTPTAKDHGYALKTPCSNCPYRSDVTPYLRAERARELANNLSESGDFACHKTTTFDDDGEVVRTAQEQQCAGALILQEKSGSLGQSTRIAERLGLYDAERLDLQAPVYSSIGSFVQAHESANPSAGSYCEVVADNSCENPTAFGGWGSITYNTDAPSCDDECIMCGNAMCSSCASAHQDGVCRVCAEDEPED